MERGKAKTFRDLVVWQKSHSLVLLIYSFSSVFPKHEIFGLTSQLKRAAISIPANIAEGFKKKSKKDKARFYNIAQVSIEECRYFFILAKDLNYGIDRNINLLIEKVSKLLAFIFHRPGSMAYEMA